jgi:hypothetical protein
MYNKPMSKIRSAVQKCGIRSIISLVTIGVMILAAGCSAERDNANDPKSPSYKISGSVSPANSSTIAGHEPIVINFTDAMDKASVEAGISGDIVLARCTRTWTANDTLVISLLNDTTKYFWSAKGSQTLIINGKTMNGDVMSTITATYTIDGIVYVRTLADGGNDLNYGTANKPVEKINRAIELAKDIYSGTTSKILVAQGLYQSEFSISSTPVINMVEGISVYGGYSSTNWGLRSITNRGSSSTYETTVEDTSSAGGSTTPNCAVNIPSGITNATVLDGFTIKLGYGTNNAGIYCTGSATITNNKIQGRISSSSAGTGQYGIYCVGTSTITPQISNNTINPGWNNNTATGKSYGIYNYTNASSTISNNTINDGYGYTTYGIYNLSAIAPTISNNTIYAGQGSNVASNSYCLFIQNTHPIISYNTFNAISSNGVTFGIYESLSSADPTSFSNNSFGYSFGTWYYNNTPARSVTYLTYNVTGNEITVGYPSASTSLMTVWDNGPL